MSPFLTPTHLSMFASTHMLRKIPRVYSTRGDELERVKIEVFFLHSFLSYVNFYLIHTFYD